MGQGNSLIDGINGHFKCISVDTFGLVIPDEANAGPKVTYHENEITWSIINRKLLTSSLT